MVPHNTLLSKLERCGFDGCPLFRRQKRGQNLQLGLIEQGEMALSSKRVDLEKEKFFYGEGGEALEQAVS